MVERSNKLLPSLKEGDKGRWDLRNLFGVVININDEKYTVWTKPGVIENILERNSLNKTKYNKIIDVPQTETLIRTLIWNVLVLVKDTNGVTVPRNASLQDLLGRSCKNFS